ncbi:uncharacterized protein LOC133728955 isoform X1 [Rosa rugosa]|uniref:uncharacterized protein LOC133728955 isoform X1 n=1 Tax=Rosa rugosa TaxID=74645 RepID=UPI002B411BB2|nr:uncharacterized protein LOC133728955 isoform X1 [Rosa rugosa]XP_062012396.1 uncharacterized protein LOC133728955 isoform X1 [Rosa rugosa]XP_062012397.1 uncharacterized protein LOC133728955 isoform X1 [Rosa rugosa]
MDPNLGQNRLEDVSWLCSLSESELDLLISLKKLVLQRAGVIGHEELAVKFDLKVLRALAFVLMTCIKDEVKDLSLVPGFEDSAAFMESCNLLKCDLGDVMSLEEIKACIGIHLRKAASKRFCNSIALNETTLSQKKQKFGTSGV